jgi:hypothetical protein
MTRPLHIALASLALLVACESERDPRVPIDQELLAALGLAQAYQHQADELASLGNRSEAITRVRRILEIPFPEGTPEREDIRLDAHGRIAELLLEEGNEPEALDAIETGLREASRASYFKARLHAVEGRLHRAKARRLRESGDEEGARAASREAIAAFELSIEVNRTVLGLGGSQEEGNDGGTKR